MYNLWNSEENKNKLKRAVKNSKSIAGVLKELGLTPAGGNYNNIKKHISKLNLDTSHFTGQGWNKDNYKNSNYSIKGYLKKYLIRKRGHKCEMCKRKSWLGSPIPLELDHIDGNNTNDKEDNLRLLCCNCHALTPTWRGRGRKLIGRMA